MTRFPATSGTRVGSADKYFKNAPQSESTPSSGFPKRSVLPLWTTKTRCDDWLSPRTTRVYNMFRRLKQKTIETSSVKYCYFFRFFSLFSPPSFSLPSIPRFFPLFSFFSFFGFFSFFSFFGFFFFTIFAFFTFFVVMFSMFFSAFFTFVAFFTFFVVTITSNEFTSITSSINYCITSRISTVSYCISTIF